MRVGEKAVLVANVSLFAFAMVSFFFLPETIVHHWGFDGPDRIGGRYHVFIPPLISGIISFSSLSISRLYEKKDPNNGEVFHYAMLMMCVVIITVCMLGVLVIVAYNI